MIDPAARARIERWKQSLLDLSTASELLDITNRRTAIGLAAGEPGEVIAALRAGGSIAIEAGAGAAAGTLRTGLAAGELARRLVAIERAARASLADHGEHTLWLGLGVLTWCDIVGAPHAAPLVLVPVTLEGGAQSAPLEGGAPPGLEGGARIALAPAGAPQLNDVLAEKLRREFDLVLAADELASSEAIAGVFDAAAAIAGARPGWRLDRTAVLGVMAPGAFAVWRDVEARGDALLAHPMVARLAAGGDVGDAPVPAVIELARRGRIDTSNLIAPLDADSHQLAVIAAAAAGTSFVVHGPPGTGKSQTIANLVAHAMAHGKTVLVVSDAVSALDVVHQRLAAVGLGEFCLELHGHKATREHVLGQLGHVLERAFRPGGGPTGDDARLTELAAALDEHVAALHRVGPFGRSLHDVLGRLVELRTTARAALAERDATGLDRATFLRRRTAVEQLAAAALPVEPVATHPWRASTLAVPALGAIASLGSAETRSNAQRCGVSIDVRERALLALDDAADATTVLGGAVRDMGALVPGIIARTGEQLAALGALADVAARSPRPGAELLTSIARRASDEVPEKIALIRARGTGSVETPREPSVFLALAHRHRLLAAEVNDRFTDSVEGIDAAALWNQLRTWSGRVAPLRYVALRAARAEIRAVAMPGMLETDEAVITALEAVIAERAARQALLAAAEPARRWFGDLAPPPADATTARSHVLELDLQGIDAAVAWAAELRRAFDAVAVSGGDTARQAAWRALVAQVAANPTPTAGAGELAAFSRLADAVARWQPALAQLADATGIDRAVLAAGDDHLAGLRERIDDLRHAIDGMPAWVAFHAARNAALALRCGPAVAAIERGDLGAGELADGWERATLLAWCEAELAHTPALAGFHGAAHHAHTAAFADLDRGTLSLVRARALVRLAERVPRVTPIETRPRMRGPTPARVEEAGGELGGLLLEIRGLRAERPLRQLLAECPTLLPRLAPCVLATPLAVARFLDPALPAFDLVVFDEASRLAAGAALGALVRGATAVVFGDTQLLPATRWVPASEPLEVAAVPTLIDISLEPTADHRIAEEPIGEVTEAIAVQEPPRPSGPVEDDGAFERVDGLFDACLAARLPELVLAWHYTSKHEDLIAFANRHYYRDRLHVLPVAAPSRDLGIVWCRVDGVYDRMTTRTNRREAEAVVAEVVGRLADPAQRTRSIGIITFGHAQQHLIADLLDEAYAKDPALAAREGEGAAERPVVKQVEATQGDERDVILVSVGYARGEDGELPASFGPLSLADAERRLAVLTTRAREQLVVFSSIGPEDLGESTLPGIRELAALLAFARSSGGAARPADDTPPASPITAAIARALAERGWVVRHQIGCGAYKLDLAVVDPNDSERHVLAIEVDGIAYASATVARDRDRLRPQALAQLGWRLHRIWALDWWLDPERELSRAHGAIITAVAASRQRRVAATAPATARSGGIRRRLPSGTGAPAVQVAPSQGPAAAGAIAAGSGPTEAIAALVASTDGSTPTATGSAPIRIARNTIPIGPYMAAAIPAGRRAPDDLFAPRHAGELEKIVEQVLVAEAPMHIDVLARRVGAYFGIGRLSQRVVDQVKAALAGRGRFGDEDNIVWRLDQDPAGVPPVRVAGQNASARRDIFEVPLSEVAAAARIIVERATGIAANDLVRDAARLLGFARTTDKVIERVASGVKLAVQRELIRLDDGKATLLE